MDDHKGLMTLKKSDGKWCPARITLACTIIGTAAAIIVAMPTFMGYVEKAIAPWTTLPDQIEVINKKIDKIARALNVQVTVTTQSTNFADIK